MTSLKVNNHLHNTITGAVISLHKILSPAKTSPYANFKPTELITNYHELNANSIDELDEEPSALEFMRYVARNRPFVIRGGASNWKACKVWNASYLTEAMGGRTVCVAVTPDGNADAVLDVSKTSNERELWFVKPHEVEEPFNEVIQKIQNRESSSEGPVHYAQTQNDNLRNEYTPLQADIPSSIPFARIALGQQTLEAINLWIGNSHSKTALHKDPYENIYVQILGEKHFVLLPPVEGVCVNELDLKAATYTYTKTDTNTETKRTIETSTPPENHQKTKEILTPMLDIPYQTIPFATWDPDLPHLRTTPFSHLSKPLRVTLCAGDMLYLPALWYHKVSQSCSEEGICCAVNYWYDMDFTGSFHSLCAFARSVGLAARDQEKEEKGRDLKESKPSLQRK